MIRIIPGYDRISDVKALFDEYIRMLLSIDRSFSVYLDIQHYDDETKNPGAKYCLPYGRLYLATRGHEAIGCVALHRLNEKDGELKRLFVRPEYRGQGVATRLISRIIDEAENIGYEYLYLDTLPELQSAVSLYAKLGFEYTSRYNDSPETKTIFMRKALNASLR